MQGRAREWEWEAGLGDPEQRGKDFLGALSLRSSRCARPASVQCAKTLKKAKAQKGIAFPTCISINNVVCHNSPMDTADSATLAAGDIVKV